jgi:hypothetical protein
MQYETDAEGWEATARLNLHLNPLISKQEWNRRQRLI